MKILAISGSLRTASSNAAILRAAARAAPPGVEVQLYDGLAALPHFSPDLDVDPLPEPVRDLRARIASVNALMISSPEYAHGVPGSLKNALDWLVSALEVIGKPVLLVSASPGGAEHVHEQLTEVLRTMNLKLVDGGAHVFTRARIEATGEVADPVLVGALQRGLADLKALAAAEREVSPLPEHRPPQSD